MLRPSKQEHFQVKIQYNSATHNVSYMHKVYDIKLQYLMKKVLRDANTVHWL